MPQTLIFIALQHFVLTLTNAVNSQRLTPSGYKDIVVRILKCLIPSPPERKNYRKDLNLGLL